MIVKSNTASAQQQPRECGETVTDSPVRRFFCVLAQEVAIVSEERQTEVLIFRAPQYVAEALRLEAERCMISKSALVRQAVAQRLGLLEPQPGQVLPTAAAEVEP